MGRFKSLKPSGTRLAPTHRVLHVDPDATRRARYAWRSWYGTARWKRLRWSVLHRDLFTCALCARVEADTSLLVADHITPHRGNPALFWNEGNLQCLCQHCHNTVKAREDASARRGG